MGPYGGRYPFQGLRAETGLGPKNRSFNAVAALERYRSARLRLKSFIPYSEKLPFEYGRLPMFDNGDSQNHYGEWAYATLRYHMPIPRLAKRRLLGL